MLSAGVWRKSQPNTILFVLVDPDGNEVTGAVPSILISKAGGSFVAGAGTVVEIGLGWYRYTSTVAESDTPGPVSVVAVDTGTLQQNLEYVVLDRVVNAVEFSYVLTSTAGNTPIPNADIVISSDPASSNIIWVGKTDSLGVARDPGGVLPRLYPGTYYFFRYAFGYTFDNPDVEVII